MKLKIKLSIVLFLSIIFNFSLAEENIDSAKEKKIINDYIGIVQRTNEKLCIKTKIKDICFIDQGSGDGKQRYAFSGMLTNNIAIVRMTGYEEYDDYFISLDTSNVTLVLPPIVLGETQLSLSPNKDTLMVITTNNGYDGDPDVSMVEIYKLIENKQIKPTSDEDGLTYDLWPKSFEVFFKDKDSDFKKYKITWLNNDTVKIQSLKESADYIVLNKKEGNWSIKNKSYKTWKDHDPLEGL